MKIAVAQSNSKKGDVEHNVDIHLKYIKEASRSGVNYIVFPELSLTGYEPELAKELAFEENDFRLSRLTDAAGEYHISIGVGAPLKSDGLPKIGLLILRETGEIEKYEKIHLHDGEEIYFSSGSKLKLFKLDSETIGNAICADTSNCSHAALCSEAGASVYIAGVLVTPDGYNEDSLKWANHASTHNMLVAISNYNKASGGWPVAGKSAIWFKDTLLAQAGEFEDAIVVAEEINGSWRGYVHKI